MLSWSPAVDGWLVLLSGDAGPYTHPVAGWVQHIYSEYFEMTMKLKLTYIYGIIHCLFLDNSLGVLSCLKAVWWYYTQINPTSYRWGIHQADCIFISLFEILIANKNSFKFASVQMKYCLTPWKVLRKTVCEAVCILWRSL